MNVCPKIEIDGNSGFCFGVVTAIRKAEEALADGETIYCLGDIVHNSDEVERLKSKGLVTITHDNLATVDGGRVLLRAHGEPPSTYDTARTHHIRLIDATCPVVLKLQKRIKETADRNPLTHQIVIYGKPGHAEVNGLVGQTGGRAIVIQGMDDLRLLDFSRPIHLYSQTTMSLDGFKAVAAAISARISHDVMFESCDTICRQVANRVEGLREFAGAHDVIIFVSGQKSSNGRYLYEQCRMVNPLTHLVSNSTMIDKNWFDEVESIGICGATSTPRWLMEEVKQSIIEMYG